MLKTREESAQALMAEISKLEKNVELERMTQEALEKKLAELGEA